MASKSIDWDEVLVTKDPKKKEVAVSFKAIDGFKPEVISPGSLCVTLASPETFTHITGSAHWVWAKLDSVPDRYVKVRLDFDAGNGIGEPTTPQYVEWFPGDDQLKQVALSAGEADDLLNSSNYRATATVEGSSCPVGQTTVDFAKDVIPPEPDPDPIPDEDTGGEPIPGDNPECGGNSCATISDTYLSLVSGGGVISFLDVTGNGNLSTANWPANNDAGYNTHRCADPEGRLSDYYYAGFTGFLGNLQYIAVASQVEAYIGSNFCRAQAKAGPGYDGIAPLGNLREQGHLLPTGAVRGFDGLSPVGGGSVPAGGIGLGSIGNCGFETTTFHFLVKTDSAPSFSDACTIGLFYRASLSTWSEPFVGAPGPYTGIYRPSASINLDLRGDGTMRFIAPSSGATAIKSIGRWIDGPAQANSVYLVSLTVSGGINRAFVDLSELGNCVGSCEIWGNLEVKTEADGGKFFSGSQQIGGAIMNGDLNSLWSPYDYQGEPNMGVQFQQLGGDGINPSLIAISNNPEFDSVFRRAFNDYTPPTYCTRIP